MDANDQACAPDRAAVRERLDRAHEGYMKNIIKGLQYAFPDKFDSEEDAYMAYDVIIMYLVNGMKNRDAIYLEGFGEFRSEPEDGRKKVIFTPDRSLLDAISE
jgi:nucleoid DNA-binding protein